MKTTLIIIVPGMLLFPVLVFGQGIIVQPGAYVTIQNTAGIKTSGTVNLTIQSTAMGTGSVIDYNSSGGITIDGTTKAERYINNDNNWHFVSTPVTSADIWPEFAPTPDGALNFSTTGLNWDFYYWNPNCLTTTGNYPWVNLRKSNGDYNDGGVEASGNGAGFGTHTLVDPPEFDIGRGYLVAYAPEYSGTTHDFTGTLNYGNRSIPVTNNSNPWNLVGNPYPSAVDWKAAGWNRTTLETNGGGGYDYWIFVGASGNYGVFSSSGTTGTLGTTRDIAPMQAFFVQAASTGNLSMTNTVQVHSTQSWLKEVREENNLLRLRLTTAANSFYDEMIVEVDPAFDNGGSQKFWSSYSEAPEIFSTKAGKHYSIDRLQVVNENSVVSLGIKAGADASYELTFDGVNDFSISGSIVLEDLKTGTVQQLKNNPVYTFFAVPGDPTERFHLRFGGPYGIKDPVTVSYWSIYSAGNAVCIRNNTELTPKGDVYIFNLLGQKIIQKKLTESSINKIDLNVPSGYYLVTLVTDTQIISEKVIIH